MANEDQLESVIAQNAELKLYLAATLRLLMEKGVVSREDIQAMLNRVDQQDGKTDRKYSGPII